MKWLFTMVSSARIRGIQAEYFDIVDLFFGKPFSEMRRNNVSAIAVAQQLVSTERLVEAFRDEGEKFAEGIREFWKDVGPDVDAYVEKLNALKGFFGGDVAPLYSKNIATSVGLYLDTVLIPDPLLKLGDFAGQADPKELLFLTAKHALNILGYRELAIAEVDPPIVLVIPNHSLTEEPYLLAVDTAGAVDTTEHASRMFGREFDSPQEVLDFLAEFKTFREAIQRFSDSSRLLIDVDWSGPLEDQLERNRAEMSRITGAPLTVPQILWLAMHGRMMQANDLVLGSAQYRGTPLVDAPTPWQYLLWKYEYDGSLSRRDRSFTDLVVSRAIQTARGPQLSVLSDLPPQALIDLRKEGAMADIREIFRKGLTDIELSQTGDLPRVADHVAQNINSAMSDHERKLRDLASSRNKFFGKDVSGFIVLGGVSIAAAASSNVALQILASGLSILGISTLKDLKEKWKEIRGTTTELRRSPAGILFRHLPKKNDSRA